MGLDLSQTAYFVDNHDLPRFLATRDSQPALRNALAAVILAEVWAAGRGRAGDTTHTAASPLPLTKVFYLLIDADIFRGRSRSTIYSHAE